MCVWGGGEGGSIDFCDLRAKQERIIVSITSRPELSFSPDPIGSSRKGSYVSPPPHVLIITSSDECFLSSELRYNRKYRQGGPFTHLLDHG